MVMLAENYEFVIGGDPDRDTIDLAVLDTCAGRVQAHLADSADGPGYDRMLTWAGEQAPGRRIWALEGTGSFAAGLVVVLLDAGETVVEVGALKRPTACCANTFPREPSCPRTHRSDSSRWPPSSTTGHAQPWAASPPHKPCNAYCWTPNHPSLRRPPEFADPQSERSQEPPRPVRRSAPYAGLET